jgi:hypothetical protein
LDGDLLLDEPAADGLDAPRLEQEVVVHEVDGAVAVLLELLELRHHVLRAPRAPLALVEDGDVAEDAGPGTAPRGLHGREAVQGEHGRHVEGHRLHEVEVQALPVRDRPLVQVAGQGRLSLCRRLPWRVLPRHAQDRRGVGQVLEEVQDELLAVAPADEVHLGHLHLTSCAIEAGEDAADTRSSTSARRADLARQDLGVGVARGREEAQPDQVRLLPLDLPHDEVVGRLGLAWSNISHSCPARLSTEDSDMIPMGGKPMTGRARSFARRREGIA